MLDCVAFDTSPLVTLAEVQDRLGWDNFVEGRISKVFLDTVALNLLG